MPALVLSGVLLSYFEMKFLNPSHGEAVCVNLVWLFLIAAGCLTALFTGRVEIMAEGVLKGAEDAVQLVIGLCGTFCLWMGIEKLAEESGLIEVLARALKPILSIIFPHLKKHPKPLGTAAASIVSNILGLSSQTPLGLKTMGEIKEALGETDEGITSMITLVVIGAAGFCIFPSSIIALRAALGSQNPAIIAGPTGVAGLCATLAGLLAHKYFTSRNGK